MYVPVQSISPEHLCHRDLRTILKIRSEHAWDQFIATNPHQYFHLKTIKKKTYLNRFILTKRAYAGDRQYVIWFVSKNYSTISCSSYTLDMIVCCKLNINYYYQIHPKTSFLREVDQRGSPIYAKYTSFFSVRISANWEEICFTWTPPPNNYYRSDW